VNRLFSHDRDEVTCSCAKHLETVVFLEVVVLQSECFFCSVGDAEKFLGRLSAAKMRPKYYAVGGALARRLQASESWAAAMCR
jgi:hypothetical protein